MREWGGKCLDEFWNKNDLGFCCLVGLWMQFIFKVFFVCSSSVWPPAHQEENSLNFYWSQLSPVWPAGDMLESEWKN